VHWQRFPFIVLGVALELAGCGDDDGLIAEGSTSRGPAVEPGNDESGFQPPDAACGNGWLDADEQCDDANEEDRDACSNACQIPCGLEATFVRLPPTPTSEIDATDVIVDPSGGIVILGPEREITTDQQDNETAGPLVAFAIAYTTEGEVRWEAQLADEDGRDVIPTRLAEDTQGGIYVGATVETEDGGTDIVVRKIDGNSGETLWEHRHGEPIEASNDVLTGLAFSPGIAPDGVPSMIASGQIRAGEGDDDVWVRKLDLASGEPIWTATWTGTLGAGFSTDDGGPIAVAADGTSLVLAAEYLDFETQVIRLLRFGAAGEPPAAAIPIGPTDGIQEFQPIDLSVDASGQILAVYRRQVASGPQSFLDQLDPTGAVLWSKTEADFAGVGGETWTISGARPTPSALVLLAGGFTSTEFDGAAYLALWLARLDAQGGSLCRVEHREPAEGPVPPSLAPSAVTSTSTGEALVVARRVDNGDPSLWLGRFRDVVLPDAPP